MIEKIIIGVVIISLGFIWWYIGGIHIDYLKHESMIRIQDYDFDDCVYDGYTRSIFRGFGGEVHYLCQKVGIYYSISFVRRINNEELQMHGPYQRTILPSEITIN